MPVLRYITWVGVALLAVLFLTDSYLPKASARAEKPQGYKIAIESRHQGPEAVTFSGENRVFPQQMMAATASPTEPPAHIRESFAKLDDAATPSAAAIEKPAQPKKTVKRKVRKPASDYAQNANGYAQNVAYQRPFDTLFQRNSSVW